MITLGSLSNLHDRVTQPETTIRAVILGMRRHPTSPSTERGCETLCIMIWSHESNQIAIGKALGFFLVRRQMQLQKTIGAQGGIEVLVLAAMRVHHEDNPAIQRLGCQALSHFSLENTGKGVRLSSDTRWFVLLLRTTGDWLLVVGTLREIER